MRASPIILDRSIEQGKTIKDEIQIPNTANQTDSLESTVMSGPIVWICMAVCWR